MLSRAILCNLKGTRKKGEGEGADLHCRSNFYVPISNYQVKDRILQANASNKGKTLKASLLLVFEPRFKSYRQQWSVNRFRKLLALCTQNIYKTPFPSLIPSNVNSNTVVRNGLRRALNSGVWMHLLLLKRVRAFNDLWRKKWGMGDLTHWMRE